MAVTAVPIVIPARLIAAVLAAAHEELRWLLHNAVAETASGIIPGSGSGSGEAGKCHKLLDVVVAPAVTGLISGGSALRDAVRSLAPWFNLVAAASNQPADYAALQAVHDAPGRCGQLLRIFPGRTAAMVEAHVRDTGGGRSRGGDRGGWVGDGTGGQHLAAVITSLTTCSGVADPAASMSASASLQVRGDSNGGLSLDVGRQVSIGQPISGVGGNDNGGNNNGDSKSGPVPGREETQAEDSSTTLGGDGGDGSGSGRGGGDDLSFDRRSAGGSNGGLPLDDRDGGDISLDGRRQVSAARSISNGERNKDAQGAETAAAAARWAVEIIANDIGARVVDVALAAGRAAPDAATLVKSLSIASGAGSVAGDSSRREKSLWSFASSKKRGTNAEAADRLVGSDRVRLRAARRRLAALVATADALANEPPLADMSGALCSRLRAVVTGVGGRTAFDDGAGVEAMQAAGLRGASRLLWEKRIDL
jgi:hypothetical protein